MILQSGASPGATVKWRKGCRQRPILRQSTRGAEGFSARRRSPELLVMKNPREGLITHINVKLDGQEVTKPQEVRILGQLIPQGRNNKSTLDKLTKATVQINGMLRRIRNKQHGLKQSKAMQLVHAFVVSTVMYGPPHLKLTKKEVEKLDILLRKAYKNALGRPEYAATKRLLELAQIRRLGGTDSGCWLLDQLGLANQNAASLRQQIELDDPIRAGVRTSRSSRNINPSESLARAWDSRPGTLYVDAAGPVSGVATAALSTSDGSNIVTKASFRVFCATEAEEVATVAIALAITCNPKATIISDSQGAVRNFAAGSVGEVAAGLLRRHPPQAAQIVWSPSHMGYPGNEVAHATARDSLPSRDSIPASGVEDLWSFSKCLLDIRLARKRFPASHMSLSKEGEPILRRLQTDTFLTPDKLRTWYPDRYASAACPWCGWQKADTYHMVWACEKNEETSQCEASEEEWYAALASKDPVQQQLLIRRAKAAQASGVLE
ncbi:hypothetical protein HPB47_001322 [Ixodes persulcatus]|uniref:Uncharacterized protein n=1 Tax=Ixodes persulcatus TaxID=34615 RepID=A0AC60PPH7_IXOPE|nr:hypothetical protein HPB47_001322 [Ixodes persulcatus]